MVKATYNEIDLLNETAKGNAVAFGKLYLHYYESVYKTAICYLHIHEQAEDTAQQVFCTIWEKRLEITHIKNFEAYILKSTRNSILNKLRRKAIEHKYINQLSHSFEIEDATPESIRIEKDRAGIFNEAIIALSPQQRKIYTLCKVEGKSYTQIANEMHISINTVKWHASTAFKSIRLFLKEHQNELTTLFCTILLPFC